MSLPISFTNLSGAHIYPTTDLGITSVVACGATSTGTAFDTGMACTVALLCQLTSGSATVNINVSDTAADAVAGLVSPTKTMTLTSTTKYFETVNTTDNALALFPDYNTAGYIAPTSDHFVGISVVAPTYNGALFSQFIILALYELVAGEDWCSVANAGFMAVMSSIGVGAGTTATPSTPTGFSDGSGILSPAVNF